MPTSVRLQPSTAMKLRVADNDVTVQLNSFGFRSPEWPEPTTEAAQTFTAGAGAVSRIGAEAEVVRVFHAS